MVIEPAEIDEGRGNSLRVLLVGEESAGVQTLKMLSEGNHRIIGVMASPTRKAVGGMTLWQHAEKLGLRTWPAEMVKDPAFARVLAAEGVDLLLNVHSLFVIKPEIVEAAAFGSYNLHPGPLPRYAGLNAPSWAIYHGETMHGVTLHRMLAGIDTGPIAYQALFDIDEADNGFSVSAKCIKYGLELIRRLLVDAASGPSNIPAIEQDLTQRNYFGKGTPEDGWLAWDRPARDIHNFVRAADFSPFQSPWINPRSLAGGREIAFIRTSITGLATDARPGTVGRSATGSAIVACRDQWLEIRRALVEGRNVNPTDVLPPGELLEWRGANQVSASHTH